MMAAWRVESIQDSTLGPRSRIVELRRCIRRCEDVEIFIATDQTAFVESCNLAISAYTVISGQNTTERKRMRNNVNDFEPPTSKRRRQRR
jgi:hypothetical protein